MAEEIKLEPGWLKRDVERASNQVREWAGPAGFQLIESAPRDGSFIRLRFRPGLGRDGREEVGQWQKHDEMPAGGAWFDRDGYYITPGPLFWAPTLRDRTDPEGGIPGRQL